MELSILEFYLNIRKELLNFTRTEIKPTLIDLLRLSYLPK